MRVTLSKSVTSVTLESNVVTAGHRLGGLFGWAVVKVLTFLLETKPAVFHRTTSHAGFVLSCFTYRSWKTSSLGGSDRSQLSRSGVSCASSYARLMKPSVLHCRVNRVKKMWRSARTAITAVLCVMQHFFFFLHYTLFLPSLKHHHGGVNAGVVMTHIIYYTQSWSKNSCLSIQMVTFHWPFTSLCHAPNVSGTMLHFLSSFRF